MPSDPVRSNCRRSGPTREVHIVAGAGSDIRQVFATREQAEKAAVEWTDTLHTRHHVDSFGVTDDGGPDA